MNEEKGFTMVEKILIVVVILGILAVIIIPVVCDRIALRRYSDVIGYLQSNHCVKMEYFTSKEEISLIRKEGGLLVFFDLSPYHFLSLKEHLIKGEELGTWTFESKKESEAPDALEVWYGIRVQEQEEI